MPEKYLFLLILIPVLLISLCVHEWAHAWVASRRGDPTPVQAGRLSLLPWAHWDLVGTILMPSACFLSGLPAFGWAKPVPVDARNFRFPRRDMALVAAAGPASNFLMAGLSAALLAILHPYWLGGQAYWLETSISFLEVALVLSMRANLALGFFNLLPLPPLDGFVIVQSALPATWIAKFQKIGPFSLLILLGLWLSGSLSFIYEPVHWAFRILLDWATLGSA